jgi:hypothetical protein
VSDDPKKMILARRARFIAAAVASVGVACGKTDTPPMVCLEPMIVPDAGPPPTPTPCLSVAPPVTATPPDAGESYTVAPSAVPDGGPQPCLRPGPPPKPTPCLAPPLPPKRTQ